MARKTSSARGTGSASAKKTTKAASTAKATKAPSSVSTARPARPAAATSEATLELLAARKRTAAGSPGVAHKPTPDRPSARPCGTSEVEASATHILARAEADINSAIDSLNNQMNTALATLTQLAAAHQERGKAVVRTAPLDRATATFQRLVAEVVDEHLSEMLPPLIALRNEMDQLGNGDGQASSPQAASSSDADASADPEFCQHGVEILDHVLALAGVVSYGARTGETFDTLIHLAVGETRRGDLADGAVAELLQPGFRSSRGKVLVPAKVRVNRR